MATWRHDDKMLSILKWLLVFLKEVDCVFRLAAGEP